MAVSTSSAEAVQPLPSLTTSGGGIVRDSGHGDGVANLAADGAGACRDVPQAKPLVGHLHDAGVLFGAKLVVVRVYGDTLAECCSWFLRLSIYIY